MNLTHHVTSLELSKRLKELGVPQESYFWWDADPAIFADSAFDKGDHLSTLTHSPHGVRFSAFLASELGEMLPETISFPSREGRISGTNGTVGYELRVYKMGEWYCHYEQRDSNDYYSECSGKTMCDAMVRVLIHLIEQGIVDPKTL